MRESITEQIEEMEDLLPTITQGTYHVRMKQG
ncbi:MAG: hypothetical protein JWQ98_3284 [Chlorobi bacterium]|nr:hypothetical protein [Chlorobiota bacterium]